MTKFIELHSVDGRRSPKTPGATTKNQQVARFPIPIGRDSVESSIMGTDYNKLFLRGKMTFSSGTTLIPSVLPIGTTHIHGVFSLTFVEPKNLVLFSAGAASICLDFLIKISAKTNLLHDTLRHLPIVEGLYGGHAAARFLRLVCLTTHFRTLWDAEFASEIQREAWASFIRYRK